jgi:hypothetical protein
MTQAIFGLCGVFLGGLITAGVQERQRRLTSKASKRLAARVIRDEFEFYRTSVAVAIERKNPRFMDPPAAIERSWREHRAALEQLPWAEWSSIQIAVVNALVIDPLRGDWDASFEKVAETVTRTMTDAIAVLERHVE